MTSTARYFENISEQAALLTPTRWPMCRRYAQVESWNIGQASCFEKI